MAAPQPPHGGPQRVAHDPERLIGSPAAARRPRTGRRRPTVRCRRLATVCRVFVDRAARRGATGSPASAPRSSSALVLSSVASAAAVSPACASIRPEVRRRSRRRPARTDLLNAAAASCEVATGNDATPGAPGAAARPCTRSRPPTSRRPRFPSRVHLPQPPIGAEHLEDRRRHAVEDDRSTDEPHNPPDQSRRPRSPVTRPGRPGLSLAGFAASAGDGRFPRGIVREPRSGGMLGIPGALPARLDGRRGI